MAACAERASSHVPGWLYQSGLDQMVMSTPGADFLVSTSAHSREKMSVPGLK